MSCHYIETRTVATPEQLSLDLARHLPQRTNVGPAIVLAERPRIFLPTIRKRWMGVVREIDRQRSSTLDRFKRNSLAEQAAYMRQLRFKACPESKDGDVFVINPEQLPDVPVPKVTTIYIAMAIPKAVFTALPSRLESPGVIVTYHHSVRELTTLLCGSA